MSRDSIKVRAIFPSQPGLIGQAEGKLRARARWLAKCGRPVRGRGNFVPAVAALHKPAASTFPAHLSLRRSSFSGSESHHLERSFRWIPHRSSILATARHDRDTIFAEKMSVSAVAFSHCSLKAKDMKTDSQFSRWLRLPTFLIAVVWSGQLYATTFVSTQSGNWSNPATWGGAGFPGCGDTVIVSVGTTVTDDATNCSSDLTVNGTLSMANHFLRF